MANLGLSDPADDTPAPPFKPNYADICAARAILQSLKLPTELVLQVMNHASYWLEVELTVHRQPGSYPPASVSPMKTSAATIQAHARLDFGLVERRFGISEDEKPKIREIEFVVASKDQGWASQQSQVGTYQTSSWTEVSITRTMPGHSTSSSNEAWFPGYSLDYEHPGNFRNSAERHGSSVITRPASAEHYPQSTEEGDAAWYLQGNRVVKGHGDPYRIVWAEGYYEGNEGSGHGEGFVSKLKDGDTLLIWARAKVCSIGPATSYFYPTTDTKVHLVGRLAMYSLRRKSNCSLRLLTRAHYLRLFFSRETFPLPSTTKWPPFEFPLNTYEAPLEHSRKLPILSLVYFGQHGPVHFCLLLF
ncbi:hypothetical protein BDV95DRAFT_499536 [Massariosphaeria phaeospora]|uniref:Uncharacterized protein n=1 Tax=Massariosphaeria phaeospora TaxID=100035 RepID=A0A7C8I7H2_9PLEO|nr:hypothetical protein BDV95DRAFT_499536 [Massariosphaeria phaeospora]